MSIPDDTTKVCSKCGEEKPTTREFFTWNKKLDEPRSLCHECNRAHAREWRLANLERSRENARRWQKENPEKANERGRRYRARNPEKRRETWKRYAEANADKIREKNRRYRIECADKVRESNRRWIVANRDKSTAITRRWQARNPKKVWENNQNRRARKMNAPGVFTQSDVDLQYTSQKGLCWWCGDALNGKYHVDHVIPLVKGGTNWPNNIVCSCADCNLRKHDKLPHEWNGRLF